MTAWVTPDYESARAIKRGERALPEEYSRFAEDFARRFGVVPLYVSVDAARPLVRVCIERETDSRAFRQGGDRLGNVIPSRQRAAADLFARATGRGSGSSFIVTFWDFESDAVRSAQGGVSKAERRHWGETLGLGRALWTVESIGWAPPVVFTHTQEQAERYRGSREAESWRGSYFDIVRRHDEFGYLTAEHCRVGIDSKENFDSTFESNWFYYWR